MPFHTSDSCRHDLFSAAEIAAAARVPVARVQRCMQTGRVVAFRSLVAPADAVGLVRQLASGAPDEALGHVPISLPAGRQRRGAISLSMSMVVHGICALLVFGAAALGLFATKDTEESVHTPESVRLVYLVSPGPGGGGGGGGLQMPMPPPPAKVKAPAPRPAPKPAVVVQRRPPVRPPQRVLYPPPPVRPVQPIQVVQVETRPNPVPLPPPPTVVAPVVALKTSNADAMGLLTATAAPAPSGGPGKDGGSGTGQGTGIGQGSGAGIGPGSGGGIGGGPFRPGTGIEPPVLLREVPPVYTDDARRRGVEGDVVLEIVVEQDGRVGNVRVVRGLGAGLEQRAVDAVRQWRFGPARRQGAAVDVIVQVSVGFKLR